ncbi:hypothetical protein F5Y10DRAFT_234930 [Nemania abortiva]|nr:hypothetical protein F5Y10DRAFT_234930 [Nemania abortiva]
MSEIGPQVLDIANTHDQNKELFERQEVRDFFDGLKKHAHPTEESCEWLGLVPYTLSTTAIPLFRDDNTDTDYQLHPCDPQLSRRRTVQHPHFYVKTLYFDRNEIEGIPLPLAGTPTDAYEYQHRQRIPLVIPIGALFVNNSNTLGENGRLSLWTGYEVFCDLELNLWFVFNHKSLESRQFVPSFNESSSRMSVGKVPLREKIDKNLTFFYFKDSFLTGSQGRWGRVEFLGDATKKDVADSMRVAVTAKRSS